MASDAKQRLLAAAIETFAAKGYLCATISEVCEAAGANIAAVNYHFDSKENLFRQVLRESFTIANERYPIDGGLPPAAAAEERLHAFMGALIRRSFDSGPAGHFNRIITHAGTRQATPDELVIGELRKLEGTTLDPILLQLLGTRLKQVIGQARMNIISLSMFPSIAPRLRDSVFTGDLTPAKLRSFIDRQVRFALAGLASLRSRPAQASSR